MKTDLPEELTPLNLHAYFYNSLGLCGCSELDEMHTSVLRLLEWHDKPAGDREDYTALYEEVGVFYLMSGLLDQLGLSEHGGSIRVPWLTPDGKRLLAALREFDDGDMEAACGVAYDGLHYGD